MNRRKFVTASGAGALAATAVAAPAIAQAMPELKWRMTSSFPKTLDTLYGPADIFCKHVAELSDNKIQIRLFGPGEIYPALERGTIDWAEWVGPYDDEKLGFVKVAPYYYYPGFWEGGTQISIYINKTLWDPLPAAYHRIFEVAARDSMIEMMSRYDHQNPQALRRLVGAGAQVRPYPREILQATWKAAHEIYDEIAAKNAEFKKVYESWRAYRDDQFLWFRVAELGFANFAFPASAQR